MEDRRKNKRKLQTESGLEKGPWGGGGVYQHRAFPLHKHLHTIAFGFADAQVDLALAEIEKGFSLSSEKQSNSKHSS